MLRQICVLGTLLVGACIWGEEHSIVTSDQTNRNQAEITVYQNGMAFVKEQRTVGLEDGLAELRCIDVPRTALAQSLFLRSETRRRDFQILEQNYQNEVVSRHKLLEFYRGKMVRLLHRNEYQDREQLTEARLLSPDGGGVYEIGDEIHLGHPGTVILPERPESLLLEPAFVWLLDVRRTRDYTLELSYLCRGFDWTADYILVLDQDEESADLQAWATVQNGSGADFERTQLKLVAGQVNQVSQPQMQTFALKRSMDAVAVEEAADMPQEAFAGYHLFDLQRATDLRNSESKQLRLFGSETVAVEREFLVFGATHYYLRQMQGEPEKVPVQMRLRFANSEENGLGGPFPAGLVRMYKPDGDGKLQFIGEDRLSRTAKDEELKLSVGQAFDLTAERRQVDYVQRSKRLYESEWEITLRNQQDNGVEIQLVESLAGNWEVLSSTHNFDKVDAATLRFRVPVGSGDSVTVRYRVRNGI